MSTENGFDVASVLKEIASTRQGFLDCIPIGDEHVAWAIPELERAGLHASLNHINRVLGRGTQRTLLPLVNEYCRQRSLRLDAPAYSAPDAALRELFAIVAKHVRQELLVDFANERERIHDAQVIADQTNAEASAKLVLIEERMAATQALKDGLRGELDEGRNERTALQGRLDQATTDLAQSRQALEDVNARLSEVTREKHRLAGQADELIQECAALRAAVSTAENRSRIAENHAATAKTEMIRQQEAFSEGEKLMEAEQGRSKMLGKRVDELDRLNTRLGNQLDQTKSRLTRQRTINDELERRSRLTSDELAEMRRKLTLLQRQSTKSEEHVVRTMAETKSLREQLTQATRESGRLRTACARMEKEHQKLALRLASQGNLP